MDHLQASVTKVLEGALALSNLATSPGDALLWCSLAEMPPQYGGGTRVLCRPLNRSTSSDVANVSWSLNRTAAILSRDAQALRELFLADIDYVPMPGSLIVASSYLACTDPIEVSKVLELCRRKIEELAIEWADFSIEASNGNNLPRIAV